jgi:hypothetical protein
MSTAQKRAVRGTAETGSRAALTGSPQRLSEHRRRTRRQGMSVALLLVLTGAAGAVFVSSREQARVDVVVLAHPIERGQIVTAADLATVKMGVDGGRVRAATPASASGDIVGRAALVDLPAGEILSPELVAAATPLAEDTVAVGVRLPADALPADTLRAGEWVRVVRTDSSSGQAQELVPRAMVLSRSQTSAFGSGGSGEDGDSVVRLAVPTDSADAVAGAASVTGGLRLLGIRP